MGKGMKTRNAAKKRFKTTGSGKVVRRHGRAAHLLTKKSRKQKRVMGGEEVVAKSDVKVLKRMLPS